MNRKQRRQSQKQQAKVVCKAQQGELLELAIQHYRTGNITGAEALYRRLVSLHPSHADSLHLLGVIAYQHGRPSKAIDLIGCALRLTWDNASFHSNLGIALQETAQASDAIRAYQRAICLAPAYAEAFSNLGYVLYAVGKDDEAVAACRRAVRLRPDYPEAHSNLGNALVATQRWADAEAACRISILLRPPYPEAYCNLGNALVGRRRRNQARLAYQRAITVNPGHAEAWANVGGALRTLGLNDEAIRCCRKAIDLNPIFPEACVNLGLAMMDIGAYRQALDFLDGFLQLLQVRKSIPDIVADVRWRTSIMQIASSLLLCYWLLGDRDKGTEEARRLMTFDQGRPLRGRDKSGAYLRYVSALYAEMTANPSLYRLPEHGAAVPLHIIGESHSLAASNALFLWGGVLHIGKPVFMMGVKMYHLASLSPDYRRSALEKKIMTLPRRCSVLVTIGEIDCRPDEGIWHAHKTKGECLNNLAEVTVAGYLGWLAGCLTSISPASVTIQGVPAPAYSLGDLDGAGDRAAFLDLISMVNRLLAAGAVARGWSFLDVFSATANEDGTSNHLWHIDSYHIRPDFYADAAPRYLRG